MATKNIGCQNMSIVNLQRKKEIFQTDCLPDFPQIHYDGIGGASIHHKKNILFENIFKADITHLINFDFYKKKILNSKIDSVSLTTQREFLLKMGILERAEIISKNMPFTKKTDIYFRIKFSIHLLLFYYFFWKFN